MAPIKIQHVISFTSQDPKHPVENLLCESSIQPWLCCPRERSRQLTAVLQLEKACQIGYIDIGNGGSAFVQIDVGRSSWSPEKAFVTLLPTATLMSPADSKLGKNRNVVRMFKEGDFVKEAASEKWDRLRIMCSQPFNKQDPFGLSFIRLRSPLDELELALPTTGCDNVVSQDNGSQLPGAFPRDITKERNENKMNTEEEKVKGKLQQILADSSPRTEPLTPMSRKAMMVLCAAKSRKRSYPTPAADSQTHPDKSEKSSQQQAQKSDGQSPVLDEPCPDAFRTRPGQSQKERVKPGSRQRLRMHAPPGRCRGKPLSQKRTPTRSRACAHSSRAPGSESTQQRGSCPICGGYFRLDYLPTHASTCGDVPTPGHVSLSSSDDSSSSDDHLDSILPEQTVSWVTCPLCGFRFERSEIEHHASTCGE
ncbi:protein XNDC1N [Spea bombifrons]|uniref:protein XNDC1N n=1 Tax=Spea bombifrons TaxID=233779 RepID=UPI00234B84E6|nr:protein XNDC1N [Spea bombifrons]